MAALGFTGLAATWGGATYSSALKQCSNLYCHGSATADWDAGTGGACGDCHGAAGAASPAVSPADVAASAVKAGGVGKDDATAPAPAASGLDASTISKGLGLK